MLKRVIKWAASAAVQRAGHGAFGQVEVVQAGIDVVVVGHQDDAGAVQIPISTAAQQF
ncbi:hypothetical protein ACFSF0_14880 [Ottowia flava]|uniref:Uncharacterized protein n=1 Tax=Ottowia flava TaxID=2675430 RepID=A0ABW4KXN1_9BURK|nr:hypothetical protein [Ottowia sp. GY511]